MLSKMASNTIFWVFGMTQLRIESQFPWPLANTLPIRPNIISKNYGIQSKTLFLITGMYLSNSSSHGWMWHKVSFLDGFRCWIWSLYYMMYLCYVEQMHIVYLFIHKMHLLNMSKCTWWMCWIGVNTHEVFIKYEQIVEYVQIHMMYSLNMRKYTFLFVKYE